MKPATPPLRALFAAAALLVVMPAPATGNRASRAAAAECTAVRSFGAWTVGAAPSYGGFDVGGIPIAVGSFDRRYSPGGAIGRAFVSSGDAIQRTTDGGCTWQGVYSLSRVVDAPSAAPAGPAALAMLASVQYSVSTIAAFPQAPGGKRNGPDTVIAILTASDGAGAFPGAFVVARSLDGGTTWTTDLMWSSVPGTPATVPVLGTKSGNPRVVVSPADPSRAFIALDVPGDATVGDPGNKRRTSLYVTSDAGATWEFVALGGGTYSKILAADPVDASTVYWFNDIDRTVEIVTTGATVQRRTLLTLPEYVIPISIDVVRQPGRPAEIVLTVPTPSAAAWGLLYRSVDGGRRWTSTIVPGIAAAIGSRAIDGGAARITASGDIVMFRVVNRLVYLTRWETRGWRMQERVQAEVVRWPVGPGVTAFWIFDLVPLDPAHRRFGFLGAEGSWLGSGIDRRVVGEFDSAVAG